MHAADAMAKPAISVSCLTGYHSPNAASRFLHIALAARDQMHMGVVNRLPSSFAVIDADIEAAYRNILSMDIDPQFVQ